jgi:hypothetical protein
VGEMRCRLRQQRWAEPIVEVVHCSHETQRHP